MSKCKSPFLIRSPVSVSGDKREPFLYSYVPCGKCKSCLERKREDWAIRMYLESIFTDTPTYFVTLTYDDEHLPIKVINDVPFSNLNKDDFIKFFKRLRKNYSGSSKSPLRYFAAGEYGDKFGRAHWHLVLFGLNMNKNESYEFIQKCWSINGSPLGFVKVDCCNIRRMMYVAKYVNKVDYDEEYQELGLQPPFHLCSDRPGLGSGIFLPQNVRIVGQIVASRQFFLDVNGRRFHIPKYLLHRLPYKISDWLEYQTKLQLQNDVLSTKQCIKPISLQHLEYRSEYAEEFLYRYRNIRNILNK